MKVVHAITLACISGFIVMFSCRYRSLNQLHYLQLLVISLLVSLLYFLPLIYIAYISYDSKQMNGDESALDTENKRAEWEKAMIRFADWFFMLVKRSDLGQFGLLLSVAVHVQIYGILLVMQWCAWHIRTITMKI